MKEQQWYEKSWDLKPSKWVVVVLIGAFVTYAVYASLRVETRPSVVQQAGTAPAEVASPPLEPINLSGTGQSLTNALKLPSGGYKVHMTHKGSKNFAVWLQDSNAQKMQLLINVIGPSDTTQSFQVNEGTYYFQVEADGAWGLGVIKL